MVKILCATLALSAVAVPVSLSNLNPTSQKPGHRGQTFQEPPADSAVPSGSSPISAELEPLPRSGNLPLANFPVQLPMSPQADATSPAAQPTPPVQPPGFGNTASWGVASAAAPQDANAVQFQPQPANQWTTGSEVPADNVLARPTAPGSLRDPSVERTVFQELVPLGQNPSIQTLPPSRSPPGPEMNRSPAQANQPQAQLESVPQTPAGPDQSRESSARQLIGELERRTSALPMPGFPLTLEEALHQTPPESRRAMVAAYWQVWRELHLWTISQEMAGLNRQTGDIGGNSEQAVRETVRELALQNSQAALRQFLPGLANGDYRPVPVDRPLIGSYTTHYEWYADRGRGSGELARLDAALPVLLQELERQAAVALKGRDRMDRMDGSSQLPGKNQNGMGDRSSGSEEAMAAFLETVCQYNSAVSHYTLTLIPNQPAPVELVRMLVPARTATTVLVDTGPARVARDFEQANSQPPFQPSPPPSQQFQQPSRPFQQPSQQPSPQFQQPRVQDQGTQPYQPMQLPGFQAPGTSPPGSNPSTPSFEPPRTDSRQPSEDLSPLPDDVPSPPAWQSFPPVSGG